MVQLAGGVTAVQVKPMTLEEEAVATRLVGAEGTAEQLPPEVLRISIPATAGWSWVPAVKAITIWALVFAVAENVSTRAAYSPTVASMSRLESTVVPSMAT